MPDPPPKRSSVHKFSEIPEESIAGQVPSDWFNYLRILLLASKYEYVSQIFVCERISELMFCWGPCGKTKFSNNEILLSLDPDSLENVTNPTVKSKLKILSESFGPNGKWGLTESDNIGDRNWINNETGDDFINCPPELEDKFYLTAHENTIPNLQECINENAPIIISHFSFHTPRDGRHANYLFFIKTSEGYICFRGDPWGFGESSSDFKPILLDEYLKIYFKELDVTYYTHTELDLPRVIIQPLENINIKCGDTGFCSTWVVVLLSLILKWIDLEVVKHVGEDQIIVFEEMNEMEILLKIKEMFEFIQTYISIDYKIPGEKRKREDFEGSLPRITRSVTTYFGRHVDKTFDEYMIHINKKYNSEIIILLEYLYSKIIKQNANNDEFENTDCYTLLHEKDDTYQTILENKSYNKLVNKAKFLKIKDYEIKQVEKMAGAESSEDEKKEKLITLIMGRAGLGQINEAFLFIQSRLHTESAFASSSQVMVIKILKCIKEIDSGMINHKGIYYEEYIKYIEKLKIRTTDKTQGGYKKNKHKKKSTKKPKKSKRPKKIKKSKRLRKKSRRKRK